MNLMDYLINRPSAQDRYQSLQPMLQGDFPMSRGLVDMLPNGPNGSPPTNDWEARARQIAMRRYDYTPQEWQALDSIIERESGWDPSAVNPSSGAYGIPQILPAAHPDANLENNPLGQIRWLLSYIQNRYNGPLNALAFKDREGWY